MAIITLPAPAVAVSVAVSPTSVTLNQSGTRQFIASVGGASNTAVTWSMSPAAGTLSASGLFTAPGTLTSTQIVTITATSVADPTKGGTATLKLSPNSK